MATRRLSRGYVDEEEMSKGVDGENGKEVEVEETQRSTRKSWRVKVLATTTFFLVAFILIYFVQLRSQTTSAWHHDGDKQLHDVSSLDSSRLHPEDHAFRDATNITHFWRVTSGYRRPDGVQKRVYLVNNEFPGPYIEARSGDTVTIRVENGLQDEGLSIHWHGLLMRGANEMDGAVGITQSEVLPGHTFIYKFTIDEDQHGTFWWHAHHGVQRADGLFGGFVVHEPAKDRRIAELVDERLLLVGDWYHQSAEDALHFYSHPGAYGMEPVPDSVLMNGRGIFACQDAVPARPVDCVDAAPMMPGISLDRQRTNIFRIVNVGAYAGFSIAVHGATLTPLALDGGHSINGSAARRVGVLHPGQRVSVLVELEPENVSSSAEVQVILDDSAFMYDNLALTTSHQFPLRWRNAMHPRARRLSAVHEVFDIQGAMHAGNLVEKVSNHADHTMVLYAKTQKLSRLGHQPYGFINRTMWVPQKTPLLAQPRSQWDTNQFVPHIPYNASSPLWVDIVLNNLDEDNHPFHLHGYNFWVLASHTSDYNWGSYNPFESGRPPSGQYDLDRSVKRDTILVPRHGYVILRLRADNPGIWMFHCHVLWHQASGMAMALQVS